MHRLVLGNRVWQVLGNSLRVREKYKQNTKDVYHFQQAEVLCERGTVSDVMHRLKKSLSMYILENFYRKTITES